MASTLPPFTWKAGFRLPAAVATWADENHHLTEDGEEPHLKVPRSEEPLTSTVHNSLGKSVLRTWPTLYNGTASPEGVPSWWKPLEQVDVLICGGGPFGLQVALSLARQGISFRIVDKAAAPLLAGRADAIQPRALEHLHQWGLVDEVTEEGPILNSTVLHKDGNKLYAGPSSQCDSRYKGIHVITQGQMEKIYIRDLRRHKAIVERSTTVEHFEVEQGSVSSHPVTATLKNVATGQTEVVTAKYLVGGDGAASSIREKLSIPFDGLTTDIYWGIMDAQFKTDWPHPGFNIIISAERGGVIVIPRENGYTRFYVQLNGEKARQLAENRKARRNASAVAETRIDDHGITPEEVLEQLNKIIAPHTIEFASTLSWFSVWKVSERVARTFSSPDLRVHIGGDAAHVHSVLGAFGLNSSIYDATNLGWKLGFSVKNQADPSILLPTYDNERRLFANRVIRCSGAYLRFICNAQNVPLAQLRGLGDELESHDEKLPALDGTKEADTQFVRAFFGRNAHFLQGVEAPSVASAICRIPASDDETKQATTVTHGARAPNPRVCLSSARTGYLYDTMAGAPRFHVVLFASDLQGPARKRLAQFSSQAFGQNGLYSKFGGRNMFNFVLVIKGIPHELEELWNLDGQDDLSLLREHVTTVFDDRPHDEDAHYWYGINHARGAAVVLRPDLWIGTSVHLDEYNKLDEYFSSFLLESTPKVEITKIEATSAKTTSLTGWRKRVEKQLAIINDMLIEAENETGLSNLPGRHGRAREIVVDDGVEDSGYTSSADSTDYQEASKRAESLVSIQALRGNAVVENI